MKIVKNIKDTYKEIKEGRVIVALTDTIYGILGDATRRDVVEYVYKIKGRDFNKPFIILVSDFSMIEKLGLKLNEIERKLLELKGVSVILDAKNEELEYLHRGKESIAVRIPQKEDLRKFIEEVGKPLIAPSCNPQSLEPAKNIEEAIKYFGNKIPVYVDEGTCQNTKPSTLVRVREGKVEILREGFVSREEIMKVVKESH